MKVVKKIKRRYPKKPDRLFTPRVRKLLYAAIRAGLPYRRACGVIGVDYGTFSSWLTQGKKVGPENGYYQFLQYIRRIEARKEAELLAAIDMIAIGNNIVRETEISFSEKGRSFRRKTRTTLPNWRAAAWRLERKYKKDYAPVLPQELNQSNPEEIAENIYYATMQLRESVPSKPTNEETDG